MTFSDVSLYEQKQFILNLFPLLEPCSDASSVDGVQWIQLNGQRKGKTYKSEEKFQDTIPSTNARCLRNENGMLASHWCFQPCIHEGDDKRVEQTASRSCTITRNDRKWSSDLNGQCSAQKETHISTRCKEDVDHHYHSRRSAPRRNEA